MFPKVPNVITDAELGMAAGFAARLRYEAANAQALINQMHAQLEKERAAHRRTVATLQSCRAENAQLRRHLAEVDALLQ